MLGTKAVDLGCTEELSDRKLIGDKCRTFWETEMRTVGYDCEDINKRLKRYHFMLISWGKKGKGSELLMELKNETKQELDSRIRLLCLIEHSDVFDRLQSAFAAPSSFQILSQYKPNEVKDQLELESFLLKNRTDGVERGPKKTCPSFCPSSSITSSPTILRLQSLSPGYDSPDAPGEFFFAN